MEADISTTAIVPKWAPEFQPPMLVVDGVVAREIPSHGQLLAGPDAVPAPRAPSRPRSISTSEPITHTSSPNENEATHPPAANDDVPPRKPRRPRKSRRKPKRDDKRRCKTTLTISKDDYENGRTAWNRAQMIGLPLDTMITLRPADIDDMTMPERREWFMKRLKSLGQWFADNDARPPFTALWAREARRIGNGRTATGLGEHIHVLVCAGEHRAALEKMLRKTLRGRSEVDVRPTSQELLELECGWMGDASTYVLKAVNQKVWKAHRSTPHRPSGPIYGARCGWTDNIKPAA